MSVNYKMIIQYDGSRYYGWEHQPGQELTIQGKLESVLSLMVGEPVEVIGAGRTDAGVHARGMVANAKFDVEKYLNHGIMLKPDYIYAETQLFEDGLETKTLDEIKEYINQKRKTGIQYGDQYRSHNLVPFFI